MAPTAPPKQPGTTNWVSISFWFQVALQLSAYCTSQKKKQGLSPGSPRKAVSRNCCREESCTNCFPINENMTCRATCLAPGPEDKAGCGNCLPPSPRTQNHILSLRNDALFFSSVAYYRPREWWTSHSRLKGTVYPVMNTMPRQSGIFQQPTTSQITASVTRVQRCPPGLRVLPSHPAAVFCF